MKKISFFFLAVLCAAGSGRVQAQNPWLLSGNAGVKPATNFLGTTDNAALRFRINNQWAGQLDSVSQSTFFGYGAGKNDTAVGVQALNFNTTGTYNIGIGRSAGWANSTGNENIIIGHQALFSKRTGNNNIAIGTRALYKDTLCAQVIAIGDSVGVNAMGLNTTGSTNDAFGQNALFSNSSGTLNVAMGAGSLFENTSGTENTGVGDGAGVHNTTGSQITVVGSNADVASGNLTNATAIGAGATVNASNKVRIGNSSVTVIEGQVLPTTPSDGRFKFNIREDVKGLDFILRLRPVSYQFDVRRFDGNRTAAYARSASYDGAMSLRRTGFIAQEVEQAAAASGYDFTGVVRPVNAEDHYSLSYESFVMPLVKAVQEQQQQIGELKKMVAEQQKMIDQLLHRYDQ